METRGVECGHHVEEEGVRVIVERLVVQEQLGHQTEVLTVGLTEGIGRDLACHLMLPKEHTAVVHLVLAAINLKEGQCLLPIDLVPRRVVEVTLGLEGSSTHTCGRQAVGL